MTSKEGKLSIEEETNFEESVPCSYGEHVTRVVSVYTVNLLRQQGIIPGDAVIVDVCLQQDGVDVLYRRNGSKEDYRKDPNKVTHKVSPAVIYENLRARNREVKTALGMLV
jgi:hypothetical protein